MDDPAWIIRKLHLADEEANQAAHLQAAKIDAEESMHITPFCSEMQVDLREWHSTSLSDTGSNICLTNNERILTDVEDIDPVSVGVAVSSTATLMPCVKKGYLLMPLADGSIHMQMFLIHTDASDTIILPECIMRSDAKFRKWAQIGH